MKSTACLFALIAAPAFAADGAGPYTLELAGKAFDERCVKLAAGESIRYRFEATAPVDFNIHFHRGKDVLYPVKKAATRRANGTFRADTADDYCLMWEQRSGAATVNGTLERIAR